MKWAARWEVLNFHFVVHVSRLSYIDVKYIFEGSFMENNLFETFYPKYCVLYEKTAKNWFWGALNPLERKDAPTYRFCFTIWNYFMMLRLSRQTIPPSLRPEGESARIGFIFIHVFDYKSLKSLFWYTHYDRGHWTAGTNQLSELSTSTTLFFDFRNWL